MRTNNKIYINQFNNRSILKKAGNNSSENIGFS